MACGALDRPLTDIDLNTVGAGESDSGCSHFERYDFDRLLGSSGKRQLVQGHAQ